MFNHEFMLIQESHTNETGTNTLVFVVVFWMNDCCSIIMSVGQENLILLVIAFSSLQTPFLIYQTRSRKVCGKKKNRMNSSEYV